MTEVVLASTPGASMALCCEKEFSRVTTHIVASPVADAIADRLELGRKDTVLRTDPRLVALVRELDPEGQEFIVVTIPDGMNYGIELIGGTETLIEASRRWYGDGRIEVPPRPSGLAKRAVHLYDRARAGGFVVRTPGLFGGHPCFRGTSIPCEAVFTRLACGDTPSEIALTFPTVDKDDIAAAIMGAGILLSDSAPLIPPTVEFVRAALAEHSDELKAMVGMSEIRAVGAVAKGTATYDDRIDLLVVSGAAHPPPYAEEEAWHRLTLRLREMLGGYRIRTLMPKGGTISIQSVSAGQFVASPADTAGAVTVWRAE